jgi:LIVCS family branched-chain amino acid:cation transporter
MLLMLVYSCLTFLGSNFSEIISNVPPSLMLITIANHVMGDYAAFFVGITIMLACFTTVVALNNIYAGFLLELFRLKNDKFKFVLLGTTVTSMMISLFDFNGIANFLIPVLVITYPSIIALTIISIFVREQSMVKKVLFYGVLMLMLLQKIS